MRDKFKRKTFTEVIEMVRNDDKETRTSEILQYIDQLHSILMNYQIVIDQAVEKNQDVK